MERSDRIEACLLDLARARGAQKTICPSEVARALAGPDERDWRLLMKPVRAAAVDLARRGRVAVKRKGKVVDPNAFKGVYRIAYLEEEVVADTPTPSEAPD